MYKIVPAAVAAQQPAPIGIGPQLQFAEEGYLTQTVPLRRRLEWMDNSPGRGREPRRRSSW